MAFKTYPRSTKNGGRFHTDYVYKRKIDLVTPTELEFFRILLSAVNREHYYVIPQVHLSTLFAHKAKGQHWHGAFQRINRKSVDFAICTLKNLNPICGIELDDKSHDRPERIERDKMVEGLFKQAELPLLRIGVHEMRDVAALRLKLAKVAIPGSYFLSEPRKAVL